MTRIEYIKTELKEEMMRTRALIDERVRAKDWAGALRREAETEALMRAWTIVCSSVEIKKKRRTEL